MRNVTVTALLIVGACATAQAQPAEPAGSQRGGTCQSEGLEAFAGREYSNAVKQEILRVSGARVARVVEPGMMVTMEYQEDRVTIWLAEGNRIERVNCG